jgi:nucleoside-diphosphate-sugar epimerase
MTAAASHAREGTVLVTGAAGFLGRHLVRALRRDGVDVRPVDNLCIPPIEPPPDDLLCVSALQLTADDLRGVSCVYHLAAWKSVPESFSRPGRCAENIWAGEWLLRLARIGGVSRIVVASSCEVYGTAPTPTPEDTPLAPRSAYAMSKASVDCAAAVLRQCGHDVVVARLFNSYGPGERPDAVVPAFCRGALVDGSVVVEGSGAQRRDFSYVTDTVAMLAELSDLDSPPGVVNIGSGESHSVLDIAYAVVDRRPDTKIMFGPERPMEIPEFRADVTLATRLFSQTNTVDLAAGLDETFAWWEEYASHV